MRQFSLPPEWVVGQPCVLEGGRARYLTRVLRLVPGDSFPGIDASGGRWLCRLREAGPERLVIAVEPLPEGWSPTAHLADIRGGHAAGMAAAQPNPAAAPRLAATRITLVQGLPKGAKMDLIVRQATEAGVARIIPLAAARSQAGGESGGRLERWRRIAQEALQQSGSPSPTLIDPPIGLMALGAALGPGRPGQLRLLLDEEGLAHPSLHGYLTEALDEVVLCVGPEGGFSTEEARELADTGFEPLKLPCAVLRTETAALYAVAAVEIVLSERPSWIPRAR
jgi:16S rRNA (uracil1498-N3)-methyltransferase